MVAGLMWSAEGDPRRAANPEFPSLLHRDPDLARIVRRSGGTIAPGRRPLTTAGYRWIRQWRRD